MRRLTFVMRNKEIELLSEQEVEMQPLSRQAATAGARHAFWYELRDARNKTLMSHPAPDPLTNDMEVFSNDPGQTMRRAPDPRSEHAFSVVLPTLEGADSVVLMRAEPPHKGAVEARTLSTEGTEVAKFTLAKK